MLWLTRWLWLMTRERISGLYKHYLASKTCMIDFGDSKWFVSGALSGVVWRGLI